jgi:hypothetical protein
LGDGFAEGLAEGVAEGSAEGVAEGSAEGFSVGSAVGSAAGPRRPLGAPLIGSTGGGDDVRFLAVVGVCEGAGVDVGDAGADPRTRAAPEALGVPPDEGTIRK